MPLVALSMPIFNKKSHPTGAVENRKLSILVTLLCTIKSLLLSTARVESDFLLQISILIPRGIKKVPSSTPAPPRTLSIKVVIEVLSTLLIGWINY